MIPGGPLIVGGIGAPYDELFAAVLRARGLDARPLGALDRDAHDRGRRALSRNPCAPLLATTGALLRHAASLERRAVFLGVGTCGPCRFALFAPAWRRALAADGHAVDVMTVAQEWGSLERALGERAAGAVLEAIAVGDALGEVVRRLRPHLADPDEMDTVAARARAAIVGAVEAGRSPLAALRAHGPLACPRRRAPRALARIVLVGEPWSLHADGAPQLHLPRVLARAGVEVEVPPLSLWLAFRAWELGAAPEVTARIRDTLAAACAAVGLGGVALPDLDELAVRARAHHPPELRGGYGHLEVALALRALDERRGHAVISIKSFGCIPSSGLSDAIVPAVLGRRLPFLSLEVSSDGEAARESRLMLRVSAAREAAEREVSEALSRAQRDTLPPMEPLRGDHEIGRRAYACTLACEIAARGSAA